MDTKKIFSNWIVKNILLAIAAVGCLVIILSILLGILTGHNKEITTPDFSNMTIEEARSAASRAGVRIEVSDSVYVRKIKRGVVFSQNPKAGSLVKKGRRVFVTKNAVMAKKVAMPSLVGYSLRQAKAELSSKGLTLGRLVYVSDIATNNVLKQLYRNREITPGRMIDSGSRIDLVLGLNSEESCTYSPNVVGMKYLRAVDAIQENSLNVSRLVFDNTVRNYSDSLNAVVYEQRPAATGMPLNMGAEVVLYLSTDTSKQTR